MSAPNHKAEIDLGLAVLEAMRTPGTRLTHRQIAAFCGCTWQAIWQIEQKALLKLRRAAKRKGLGK